MGEALKEKLNTRTPNGVSKKGRRKKEKYWRINKKGD